MKYIVKAYNNTGSFYGYAAKHPDDEQLSYYDDDIANAIKFDTYAQAENYIDRFIYGSELQFLIANDERSKTEILQGILNGCGLDFINVNNYDFTQPDSMDESDSGGAWDLAGLVADSALAEIYEQNSVSDLLYQRTKDNLQSLFYNLFCAYKTETGDDE